MQRYCVILLLGFNLTFVLSSPTVDISQGLLSGSTLSTRGGRKVLAFLGIPYAAPPIGQLRFKSPQPPPSWEGVRDASKEAYDCIQQFILIEELRNTVTGSEDCLYLNVFTPMVSSRDKFPVMFYIHGGGYAGGSGTMVNYGPELLLDKDVVLVTINYRLGPLGFLSTGDTVLPGNLGLKDQLAALRWVQSNIQQFGGDKDMVTIFGQSAGGASVHLHILSPQSKGLFHAAVSQSGTALCPWAVSSSARHKQLAARLAQLTNCPSSSSQTFLDCLRALPAEKIVSNLKNFIVWDMDPVVVFNPAIEPEDVEDAFLTQSPWTLTSTVPWMVGFNEEDGSVKLSSLTQGDVQGKLMKLNDDFGNILPMSLMYQDTAINPDKVTQAIRKFYFGEVEKITLESVPELVKMYTDAWLTHGTLEAVRHHQGPVFLYHFAYNSSFSLCSEYYKNPKYFGVCHFDELLYLFPMEGHAPKLVENNPDYIMSAKMVQLWTNFAKSSIPTLDDLKKLWQSNKGSVDDYLQISKDVLKIEENLLTERDQFWKNLPFRENPLLSHSPKHPINEL